MASGGLVEKEQSASVVCSNSLVTVAAEEVRLALGL
jgi:hypothetical protein